MKEMIFIVAIVSVVIACNGLKKEKAVQIEHQIGEALTITRDAE